MAAQEDEIKSLKEKNNELVQKVQYWKMTAAQRENEKLELMKEVNELRLKLIRLKSGGAASARKLEAALQAASTQALSHLVEASGAVARTLELAKSHAREREGAAAACSRWSSISSSAERVHRVPPLMIGGQSIQPVVSLSRAAFNVNTSRQTSRSPNSTRNVTVNAVPAHILQDVYIPLTRIDVRDIPNNTGPEPEAAADDSADNIPFDTSMEEAAEEARDMTEDYDSSRRLDMVAEDPEPGDEPEERTPPRRGSAAGAAGAGAGAEAPEPRPGPSRRRRLEPEPDSTTDNTNTRTHTPEAAPELSPSPSLSPPPPPRRSPSPSPSPAPSPSPSPPARVFTPTVRRRKRSATPPSPPPPPPPPPRDSIQVHTPNGAALCSRVLQVLLPKLPAPAPGVAGGPGGLAAAGDAASPSKRRAVAPAPAPRFDAPSPNGATERGIVSEEVESPAAERRHSPAAHAHAQDHRSHNSQGQESWRRDSGDSDSSEVNEGRARRNRRPVTYKERPLNRKLRR